MTSQQLTEEQTILKLAEIIRVTYLRGSRDPNKENMTETIHELRDNLLTILATSNREARIDELSHIAMIDGKLGWENIRDSKPDVWFRTIEDRLIYLKAEKEQIDGQSSQ